MKQITHRTGVPIMNTNRDLMAIALLIFSQSVFSENMTYEKVCKSCHSGGFKGFVSGAPNINRSNAWEEYIERHSIDKMKAIVLTGSNNHKEKGGCKKCSDDDIKGAVEYMVAQVK